MICQFEVQTEKLIHLRAEDMISGPFQDMYTYLYQFSGLFASSLFLPSVYIKDNTTQKSAEAWYFASRSQNNLCTWSSSCLPNPKCHASNPPHSRVHHCYSFTVSWACQAASVHGRVSLSVDRVKQPSAEITPMSFWSWSISVSWVVHTVGSGR